MTKTRLMAFLVLSVTLICGCMGGGGSGSVPAFEKDVAGITATLNRFAESLRTGDPTSSGVFAQTASTSESTKVLYVKDFGADLNNPDDNHTWEFMVNPADITQPAPDTAIVKASKVMSTGNALWLIFSMVKEESEWKIEAITIQETGVTSFTTASYFPIVPGDRMTYYSSYQGSSASINSRKFSADETYQHEGVTYYRYIYDYAGNQRRSGLTGTGAYYANRQGEIWIYESYSGGVPQRLLKASYAPGEKDVIVLQSYGEGESTIITLTIGSQMKEIVTPLRTFRALPITQESYHTGYSTSATSTSLLYFVENVGLVGQETFQPGTTVISSSDYLYERLVGGVLDSNNPVITSSAASSQKVIRGQDIVPVQFSTTSGSAPFTWSVTGAPTGVTITSNSTGGYLSGKTDATAAPAPFNLTISVVDAYNRSATFDYSIELVDAPPLSITPTNGSQNVTAGHLITPVSFTVGNATGNVTWTVDGPTGITIAATGTGGAAGVMSGEIAASVAPGPYAMTVYASDSNGAKGSVDYTLVVETGTYETSRYYPLVPEDEYTYVPIENGVASEARYSDFTYAGATVINGLNFFMEGSSYVNPTGSPVVSMRASLSPLHRISLRGQAAPAKKPWYRAVDNEGNIWFYNQDVNKGAPFKSLRAWYNPGDVDFYVTNYDDGVDQYIATTTMTVASALETSFFTPCKTFNDVLKVTFVTEVDYGGGLKEIAKEEQYFVEDFGMVALKQYEAISQTEFESSPSYYELLLSASLGGTLYDNLPQYTTGEILNSAVIGNIYTQVNLGVSGGNTPYSFALKAGSALPAGLSLSSDGQITGIPTSQATGEKSFTIVAKDAYHQSVEMLFKITVF